MESSKGYTEIASPAEPADGIADNQSLEELEQAISQAWRDVFNLDKIDRDDNFFELGGNSLLGMNLTEILETRAAIRVPVLVVFQYPTIREMAEIVAAAHRS
jgi:hypothetical protein